jgi:hypothetical protein
MTLKQTNGEYGIIQCQVCGKIIERKDPLFISSGRGTPEIRPVIQYELCAFHQALEILKDQLRALTERPDPNIDEHAVRRIIKFVQDEITKNDAR